MKNKLYLSLSLLLTSVLTAHIEPSAQEKSEELQMFKLEPSSAVFLTSPAHTFAAEFTALYLQPLSSNLLFAAEAIPFPLPSPNWKIFDIKPDYHFGFDVGVQGMFRDTHSNLMLNWEHFHSKDSTSEKVSLATDMVGPFFEIGPDADAYQKLKGHVTFHFDAVNLDYGLLVNFGDRLETNLFGGVAFARIHQTLSSRFSSFDGSIVREVKTPSKFIGAGPQLGMNLIYHIIKGLHLAGATSASLLVGSSRNHTTYKSFSPDLATLGITPPNKQSTHVAKTTHVVPAFDGSLGLNYMFGSCCKKFMVKLEAGYQIQIYLNAIQSVDMGSQVPVLPDPISVGVFARTFETHANNFALAGPYFTVDFEF